MGYINIIRNIKHSPITFDPTQKSENDAGRVKALRRYRIFDTPSEEIFSAFTELAALTFKVPIGLMSFVDDDQVFYKQAFGVERTGELVPRKNSPCSLAILSKEVTQFRYALSEPCVLADEKTLAEAGYKFYAGAPLITQDGFNIGMLAVVDKDLRIYTESELVELKKMAGEVMREVEMRIDVEQSKREINKKLRQLHNRVEALRR